MCAMSRWKGSRLVMLENRPKTSFRRIKSILEKKRGGWDTSPPPQNHQKLPKIVYFGQSLGVLGVGKEHPTTPKNIWNTFGPSGKRFWAVFQCNSFRTLPSGHCTNSQGHFRPKIGVCTRERAQNFRTQFLPFFIFMGHTQVTTI